MRTTITLEPDVEDLIKRAMEERGMSFKQAVNEAIRAGFAPRRAESPTTFPTYRMGTPLVDITKALRLAGELEDQELVSRLARGT